MKRIVDNSADAKSESSTKEIAGVLVQTVLKSAMAQSMVVHWKCRKHSQNLKKNYKSFFGSFIEFSECNMDNHGMTQPNDYDK